MDRLVTAGLVKHERIFHGRHGVYRLSKKGAGYTDLPALARITLAHYNHSLAVLDVYLYLRKKHPEAEWLSERHLIQEKYLNGVGKAAQNADDAPEVTSEKAPIGSRETKAVTISHINQSSSKAIGNNVELTGGDIVVNA